MCAVGRNPHTAATNLIGHQAHCVADGLAMGVPFSLLRPSVGAFQLGSWQPLSTADSVFVLRRPDDAPCVGVPWQCVGKSTVWRRKCSSSARWSHCTSTCQWPRFCVIRKDNTRLKKCIRMRRRERPIPISPWWAKSWRRPALH